MSSIVKIAATVLLVLAIFPAQGQKFMTRTGKITFFSATPLENIEGKNNESACVLDAATGALQFVVPVKSFKFKSALMEEHFNENYMESDKFSKSDFKGKITDMSKVNLTKNGDYPVTAAGKLTIHGETHDVSVPGTLTVKSGSVQANAVFNVKCADYGIKIPSLVAGKIAESIKITVAAPMQPIGK